MAAARKPVAGRARVAVWAAAAREVVAWMAVVMVVVAWVAAAQGAAMVWAAVAQGEAAVAAVAWVAVAALGVVAWATVVKTAAARAPGRQEAEVATEGFQGVLLAGRMAAAAQVVEAKGGVAGVYSSSMLNWSSPLCPI